MFYSSRTKINLKKKPDMKRGYNKDFSDIIIFKIQ